MEPEDKVCWQDMDAENKGCYVKAQPYHHRYQKGVLIVNIWCYIKIALPNK